MIPVAVILALLALPGAAGTAAAQGFDLGRSGDQPIQVMSDNGIEWLSEDSRVIARGNAQAARGDITVNADELTAHYRKGANGDEIWRLDADGNVTIRSTKDTATGVKAIYDIDKAVFILKGSPARLVTPAEKFSASESLEYWETKRMAVLRGDAVAVQADKTLRADVLTAHFKDKNKDKPGAGKAKTAAGDGDRQSGLELHRADAHGHVRLTTPTETITGDRGDYDLETGIATVSGSVKINRGGGSQLEGGHAHVNLNTGVSKLFAGTPGGGGDGKRVQGIFVPQKKGERPGFSGSVPAARTEGDR